MRFEAGVLDWLLGEENPSVRYRMNPFCSPPVKSVKPVT